MLKYSRCLINVRDRCHPPSPPITPFQKKEDRTLWFAIDFPISPILELWLQEGKSSTQDGGDN